MKRRVWTGAGREVLHSLVAWDCSTAKWHGPAKQSQFVFLSHSHIPGRRGEEEEKLEAIVLLGHGGGAGVLMHPLGRRSHGGVGKNFFLQP